MSLPTYSPRKNHSDTKLTVAGDLYDANTVFEPFDSLVLQLNPARESGSPHPFANVLAQIKELGTAREFGPPAPIAHEQQIDPALEFVSPPPPAQVQPLDPTPDFDSPAPSAHVPDFNSALEFGSPTPSAHDQHFHPAFGFGSPPPIDYAQPYDLSLVCGSLAPLDHVSNIAPAFEFGLPAPFAHVPNFNSALEFGSPAPFDYGQPFDCHLDFVPPEGFQYSQLNNDATGTKVPTSTAQAQVVDPRLQAVSLLDFQDQEYDTVTGTVFPAIFPHRTCIHYPRYLFPIASNQAAQYGYHCPQTDMSTTSPHEQTSQVSGTSSPANFHHQVDKDSGGLHGDGKLTTALCRIKLKFDRYFWLLAQRTWTAHN